MNEYYKKWFYPLLIPLLVLFSFVIVIPFILGIIYSFTSWRGTYFANADTIFEAFVGFANYVKAFKSERFLNSLVYTIQYTVLAVIVINIVGLSLALLVSAIQKSAGIFRTIFFLPNLLGGLALGFIWQIIFQTVYTDILFGPSGIIPIELFAYMTQDAGKNLIALTIVTTWQSAGYMMIIYVAGLNTIPNDLYEAAQIDGASSVQRFFRVTLPMLVPSITVVLFLTLANSFKLLDQNLALTDGNFSTRMLALQILRTTKDTTPPDYGMAQAQAVIFFIIVATISIAQVYFTKKKEVEL